MNTVFKLYFQAWIFLAISFPFFALRVLRGLSRRQAWQALAAGILVVGSIASLCYPAVAAATRWRGFRELSLDGNRYLDREHPDDAAAIRWMRASVEGRPVVLEATGAPYSYFARVSSNTGLPTLLGWANHEGVWRGHLPLIEARKKTVQALYESTDARGAARRLRHRGVQLVFVGELEHERYPAEGLAKFETPDVFARIFRSGVTAVYRVEPAERSLGR